MSDVESVIRDFKANIPIHFNYPCIKNYQFTPVDKKEIEDYIKKIEPWNERNYSLTRDYLGEIARDRTNENEPGMPILEYE